jgi:hypothetical protein
MHGHRLCLGLRHRRRNELAVARWPPFWSAAQLAFLDKGVIGCRGQGSLPSRALQGKYEASPPLEAFGNAAEHERVGAVLGLVVAELARFWRKQRRKRGATRTAAISAVPQPTSEERTWKP